MLTLLPIAELRGGLPYALLEGDYPLYIAYPYCVIVNTMVAPVAYIFLDTAHRLFYRMGFYRRLFDRFVERARRKVISKIDRWGFWGITIFVGIPLPVTGVWTGTLAAWFLGLSRRRTILAVLAGVAISGLIVSTITLLGVEALDLLIKHV